MSVRTKILIGLGVLLALVAGLVIGADRMATYQEETASRVNRTLTTQMAPARDLSGLAKDIRYHVI